MKPLAILAFVMGLLPTAASAYVGPGAGLSLLGALWALIVAIVLAVAFVVAWPVRRMMRNRRNNQPQPQAEIAAQTAPVTGQGPSATQG